MISNITFIIIARNEQYAIRRCLDAIIAMDLCECEILCVDSSSSDNTLAIMLEYASQHDCVRVFRCDGYSNASMARNVGVRYACKDYLLFVDGDIELKEDFVRKAQERLAKPDIAAVCGELHDVFYDPEYARVLREQPRRFGFRSECTLFHCGGTFLTTRRMAQRAGYYDERLLRGQDRDFTARISRFGELRGLPDLMGVHHTKEYMERPLQFFLKGVPAMMGTLLRRNCDRPGYLWYWIRGNKGFTVGGLFALFFVGLVVLCAFGWLDWWIPTALLGFALFLEVLYTRRTRRRLLSTLLEHLVYPLFILYGFVRGRGIRENTADKARACVPSSECGGDWHKGNAESR